MSIQDLLETPIIPLYIAEYIETRKGYNEVEGYYDDDNACSLGSALDLDTYGLEDRVKDYLINNSETFAIAWIYDYEIESNHTWVVSYTSDMWGTAWFCGFYRKEPLRPNGYRNIRADGVLKFTSKDKATRVAKFIGGKVEELI